MKWIGREGEETCLYVPFQVKQGERKFGKAVKWEPIRRDFLEVWGEKYNE